MVVVVVAARDRVRRGESRQVVRVQIVAVFFVGWLVGWLVVWSSPLDGKGFANVYFFESSPLAAALLAGLAQKVLCLPERGLIR